MGVLTYLLSSFAAAVLGQSSVPLVRTCRWRFRRDLKRFRCGRGRWNLDRFGAGFADVYKGQLYGLGDGEGGECRMHFQRPLKCTGFASLSKKDRLCKGHMQDMPIPHAFWQPA